MRDNLDDALEVARAIISQAADNIERIVTEEDAKVQIIQRMITEVLGWRHSDIGAEVRHENGFSDYALSDHGSRAILVEAKRIGLVEIKGSEKDKSRQLKLSGPALTGCSAGIDQAAGYAGPNGYPIAVLTDGCAWIVFKPHVPNQFYKDMRAFVYPSLNAILNNFAEFYDLLAKEQFQKKIYRRAFDELHEGRGALAQPLVAPINESSIRISQKSSLAFDLDKVFSSFFARISDENDEEMIVDCFVESRESRIADFSLEKMTASVLGNIVKERDVDAQLSQLIEAAVSIDQGETVFIIGPTGAGKSTFLRRFFSRTLDVTLRRRCLVMAVDCLDSTGLTETGAGWLIEALITSIEQQLFVDGSPDWNDLQGLFHLEYLRRIKGVDKFLYEQDKDAFKIKFASYVEESVQKDREGYLRKLLSDVVQNRKMLPIILIDNSDEFSLEYKSTLFQSVQALRRHVTHCLIIFPVTDKSAWSFSKTDLYGIYQSRSFFLPTPPPREVFKKRIDYLRKKIGEVRGELGQGSYFLSRGISVSISDLGRFAGVLEDIFVEHDFASKTVGELSNYNIRRTLSLSKRVMTSAVFDVDEIIRSFVAGVQIANRQDKFMNALMKGDYELFRQNDSHEIFPVFSVDSSSRQSSLMNLRVLSLLYSIKMNFRDIERQHMTVRSISDYFDALGATEGATDTSLLWLLRAKLIEPYDTSVIALSPAQRVSISHSGACHLRLSCLDKVFLSQMALTTPIRDENVADRIRYLYSQRGDYAVKMAEVSREFISYALTDDACYLNQDVNAEQYANQTDLLDRLRKLGGLLIGPNEPSSELPQVPLPEEALGEVEWFDVERGYGFVHIDELDEDAFIHADRLREAGIGNISEGDVVRCKILRNSRGLAVAEIISIGVMTEELDDLDIEIVKVLRDRGYGFAKLLSGGGDVFFHLSVFTETERVRLGVGRQYRAKIAADKAGRLQVRQVVC